MWFGQIVDALLTSTKVYVRLLNKIHVNPLRDLCSPFGTGTRIKTHSLAGIEAGIKGPFSSLMSLGLEFRLGFGLGFDERENILKY